MSLSSNSIIHLTKEKSSLQGILQNNFRIKFCSETIQLNEDPYPIKVPMVSFCDIPLSQIKNHINSYGVYGIGMTKEWAIKNKLNPVLYIEQNSNLAQSYTNAFDALLDETQKAQKNNKGELNNELRNLLRFADVIRYVKNYEGKLERNDVTIDNYRFSDEREWRYVPPITGIERSGLPLFVPNNAYLANKETWDLEIANMSLDFEPNDIKYIIIESDAEIHEFINILRHTKGGKYPLNEIERLTTRIMTVEQIKGDI